MTKIQAEYKFQIRSSLAVKIALTSNRPDHQLERTRIPVNTTYSIGHLIVAAALYSLGQVGLFFVVHDDGDVIAAIAPQIIAVLILFYLTYVPLRSVAPNGASLNSLSGLPKRTIPIAGAGIIAALACSVLLPRGTFDAHPAALSAVSSVLISATLLPLAALVFQILVVLLVRFTNRAV